MISYPLCDAHAHPGTETELQKRSQNGIFSLLSAGTPPEANALSLRLGGDGTNAGNTPNLLPTAGLHPWYADRHTVSEMLPYLNAWPVIGEIGMDNVWCDTPLPVQEQVFREQLAIACELKKPVILHTKGQEAEIASIIEEYPNTYLVHWYSADRHLERYLALDCYFSIGPDVWWNADVRRVAAMVPLNRLLIETDGMGAVAWAYAQAPTQNGSTNNSSRRKPPESIAAALSETLITTAEIRQMAPEELGRQVRENLIYGFLSHG